jgi:hypothetical protein
MSGGHELAADGSRATRRGAQIHMHSPEELSCVTLTQANKQRLFKKARDDLARREQEGHALLERLQEINKGLAEDFGVKTTLITGCPFRVMTWRSPKQSETVVNDFIAVSYCWRSDDWKAATDSDPMDGWPFPRQMVSAIIQCRPTSNSGIWLDQICITQGDDQEKSMAVACMDIVYNTAKRVLIILEDVELSDHEISLIEKYEQNMDETGFAYDDDSIVEIEQLEDVARVLLKILTSRWFTRAWCAHEFHSSSRASRTSTCKFLCYRSHSTQVTSEPTKGTMDRTALGTFCFSYSTLFAITQDAHDILWQEEVHTSMSLRDQRAICSRLLSLHLMSDKMAENDGVKAFRDIGLNMMAPVLDLGCSLPQDYISIMFNIFKIPLYFHGRVTTTDECRWIFIALSFAAGAATSICTTGARLHLPIYARLQTSWAQELNEIWYEDTSFASESYVSQFTPTHIELDLLIIKSAPRSVTAISYERARKFSYSLNIASERDVEDDGMIQLLAGMLDCGLDWIGQALQLWAISAPDFIIEDCINDESDDTIWNLCTATLFPERTESELYEYRDTILRMISLWLDGSLTFGKSIGSISTNERGDVGLVDLSKACNNSKHLTLAVPRAVSAEKYQQYHRLWILESIGEPEGERDSQPPRPTILIDSPIESPADSGTNGGAISTCEKAATAWNEQARSCNWRLVDRCWLFGCPILLTSPSYVELATRQVVTG